MFWNDIQFNSMFSPAFTAIDTTTSHSSMVWEALSDQKSVDSVDTIEFIS